MKIKTIEEMKEIATERGGQCLSVIYIGDGMNLKWMCKDGHNWDATPHNICRGTWCPKCANIIKGIKKRGTIEEMKLIAIERGGECLSKEYVTAFVALEWRCSEGHIWSSTPQAIKNSGHWCPICATKRNGIKKRNTIEQMKELAIQRGGECLSNIYEGGLVKIEWKCKEGHTWKAKPNSVNSTRASWCPKCGDIKSGLMKRKTIEEMRELAKRRGGEFLSDFYNGMHIKHKWKCKDGHIWYATSSHIKHRNHWCPTCKSRICEIKSRLVLEKIFGLPFSKSKPKWLINPETGGRLEFDGYNESLNIAFEYQGIQHYKPCVFPHTNDYLESYKKRDNVKKILCSQHQVTLIELPDIGFDEITEYIINECRNLRVLPNMIHIDSVEIDRETSVLASVGRLEFLRELAKKRGGEYLLDYYVKKDKLAKWKCKEGHTWEASPGNVKRGTWCPFCAKNRPLDINYMKELAKKRGGECLSNIYINRSSKLIWMCKDGHVWKAISGNIIHGSWCPKCMSNKLRLKFGYGIKEMQRLAELHGGLCLSKDYINAHMSINWQCSEGHIWDAEPRSIIRGSWCPVCARH